MSGDQKPSSAGTVEHEAHESAGFHSDQTPRWLIPLINILSQTGWTNSEIRMLPWVGKKIWHHCRCGAQPWSRGPRRGCKINHGGHENMKKISVCFSSGPWFSFALKTKYKNEHQWGSQRLWFKGSPKRFETIELRWNIGSTCTATFTAWMAFKSWLWSWRKKKTIPPPFSPVKVPCKVSKKMYTKRSQVFFWHLIAEVLI